MENASAKDFLQHIISNIVDDPSAVSIEERNDDMGVLLSVRVAQEDMGKVIGKQGKTAEAIRELLRVMGYRTRACLAFKLEEPEGSTRGFGRGPGLSRTTGSEFGDLDL